MKLHWTTPDQAFSASFGVLCRGGSGKARAACFQWWVLARTRNPPSCWSGCRRSHSPESPPPKCRPFRTYLRRRSPPGRPTRSGKHPCWRLCIFLLVMVWIRLWWWAHGLGPCLISWQRRKKQCYRPYLRRRHHGIESAPNRVAPWSTPHLSRFIRLFSFHQVALHYWWWQLHFRCSRASRKH